MATDITLTPTANMPPVTTETTGSTATSGASGITPSQAAQKAATADIAQAEQIATAQDAVGAAQQPALEAQAQKADAVAAEAARQAEERARLIAQRQPLINAAKHEADLAEQQFLNHKFYDYWDSKSTGDVVTARLGTLLTGIGAAGLGMENSVMQKLQRDIDRDFEKQKVQLHSLEKAREWKRQGVTDIYEQLQKEMATLEAKQAKATEAVASKFEAMALRANIPVEVAKNNVVTQTLREKATEKRLSAEQRYEQHFDRQKQKNASVQTTSAKASGAGGGVEADKNAANFDVLKNHGTWIVNEMPKLSKQDVQTINRAMSSEDFLSGKGTVDGILGTLGIDSESGLSPHAKEYLDRAYRAAEGLGRVESGAAIGTVENRRFMKSLTPRVSDAPTDLKGRADRILEDINSRGQFLQRPPKTGGSAPQGATGVPPRGTVQRNRRTGAVRVADGKGGWKEMPSGR